MSEESKVAALFNDMADEYDRLEDEWYPHFFREVERIERRHLPPGDGRRAIDVGCGTGLQSVVLQSLGYAVTGVDIAADLVAKARAKTAGITPAAEFTIASAEALPFGDATFSAGVSCGSVLGFVPEYGKALSEIARVLEPGATFVLEVDNRWNLDLAWGLADVALGGRLGFDQTWREAWANVAAPPARSIVQHYPFTKLDGSETTMTVRLFSLRELFAAARARGLEPRYWYGIHAVTNVLPSTWLAHPRLSSPLRRLARLLARADRAVSRRFPFRNLGNNAVLVLERARAGSQSV